jgi:hypothetical protein
MTTTPDERLYNKTEIFQGGGEKVDACTRATRSFVEAAEIPITVAKYDGVSRTRLNPEQHSEHMAAGRRRRESRAEPGKSSPGSPQ